MRLRYLHLQNYPPIRDIELAFASGSPLGRECAIRFVVGVNGSGKSNLLRAVAEVFLALADERLPPFPVSLMYELGRRGQRDHYTFLVDCPGPKSDASIWMAQGFHWPDDTPTALLRNAVEMMRASEGHGPEAFSTLVPKGTWPQQPGIAMPKAVLAYTTGDLRPWRSVWSRDQDGQGLLDGASSVGTFNEERPAGWSVVKEAALQAALQASGQPEGAVQVTSSLSNLTTDRPDFRRPVLLDATLLKCALLTVTLRQAFLESAGHWPRTEQGTPNECDQKDPLQELLGRGGWHHLVSVGFRSHLQLDQWDQRLRETAHDWWLCASEVVAEPHPIEARRTVLFDLGGTFNAQEHSLLSVARDDLQTATTQGEALWALLGAKNATALELFTRLLDLNRARLFDDVLLRLRRQPALPTEEEVALEDIGVLRFEELSDGEQMVLGRMALFHLLRGHHDALLLLDEPETHFNDKWKREIVDIIDDAIGQTANDVLISTHSAIVLSDVFNNEIVMVQKTANGSGVRSVDEPTFATDPSALMMTVFGADDSIGKRAQEYIESRLQQADGSQEDIAQLEALVSRMGSGFYRSELRTLINTLRSGDA